jgi:membrane protein DedA with SNARE-associated domain
VDFQRLLIEHGLAAVLIGSAVEGDFTMVFAGVVAHLGYFSFPAAVGFAALGACVGDSIWYVFGRAHTTRFRSAKFYQKVGPHVEKAARKLGLWQIVASRFIYGTRIATMLFWGLHGLGFLRFVLFDALGCLLSAVVFVGLGYVIGNGADVILHQVKRFELVLLGAAAVTVLVLLGLKYAARRRESRGEPAP